MRNFKRFCLFLTCVAVVGCYDSSLEPVEDPRTLDPEFHEAEGEAVVQSERMDSIARFLAMAMNDPKVRRQVIDDLRDSPFPQHRIHMTEYLSGDRGRNLAVAMAESASKSLQEIDLFLKEVPDLALIVPRSFDRVTWAGDDSPIVVGFEDVIKSHASCSDKMTDTCSGNVLEPQPLEVYSNRRLGLSWGSTLVDCIGSPSSIHQECYWTATRFQGWAGSAPDAGGYQFALAFFQL